MNEDPAVDGILVQSPLPKAMGADAEQQVFDAIDPAKDVDGFSPISAGRLVQNRDGFAPCTPAGVIELLVRISIPIEGKHAVVIGRSDIVGKPMAVAAAASRTRPSRSAIPERATCRRWRARRIFSSQRSAGPRS